MIVNFFLFCLYQQSLNEIINADLLKIHEWFKVNKLKVNHSKSNIIMISSKLNKLPVTIETYLNSTLIPQTTAVNYLGIIIDSDLKFHDYILLLEHKISRTIGILSKLCHFFYLKVLSQRILYSHPKSTHVRPDYLRLYLSILLQKT